MDYDKEFENHVVSSKFVSKENNCGFFVIENPNDCNFWFKITFSPGIFMLSGDIGEMVFKKPIGWLQDSSLNSTSYLLEKLSEDIKSPYEFSVKKVEEFLEDEVRSLINETEDVHLKEDLEDAIIDTKNALSEAEDKPPEVNMYEFYNASRPLWDGCDPPNVETVRHKVWLQIAALRKFHQLVPNVYE